MNNKNRINMMTFHAKRLFLLFVLGFTCTISSLAAQWTEVNGLRFLIDTKSKTATLSQSKSTYTGDIAIPERVTYIDAVYPVVALGDSCFKNSKITSVSIPSSVVKLGISCFYKCLSLKSINLPDNIKELPDSCFYIADLSNELKLPENLEQIGNYCFAYSKITQIELPSSLKIIGASAFAGTNLTSIEIPNSIKSIENSCFASCQKLTKVKLPSSLETMGPHCFSNCNALVNITLPNTLYYIGNECFWSCSKLEEITLPSSLTSISDYSFAHCNALATININSKVTRIFDHAFDDCKNIQTINCYATEPPTLDRKIFPDGILTTCILNVPEGSETKYREAGAWVGGFSAWKDFKNIYTLDGPEPGLEPLTANVTDTEPNIPEGTYYAGNLVYTRTGSNVAEEKYASLCLPFDINLAETECFSNVFIPMNIALYNTDTKLLTMMLDKADMSSVIKAGQPFLAKLKSDKIELKNCNSTYISSNYADQKIETAFKVYDTTGESGVLQQNQKLDVRFGGTYKRMSELDENVYKTFYTDGMFYDGKVVTPYRAYIYYKANTAAQAAVQSISWGVGDETTGIKYIVTLKPTIKDNKVFTLDGKLVNQTGDTKSLKKGIYIINGHKIFIK